MKRFYFAEVVAPDGSNNFFRSAVYEHGRIPASCVDGRADFSTATGYMLVIAEVTDLQHADLISDPRIIYTGLDESNLDNPISSTQIAALENKNVPAEVGLTGRQAINRIARRLQLRHLCGIDDITTALDSDVSIIPANVKTAVKNALSFDIPATGTVRDVLKNIIANKRLGDFV